jgi:hypothetical protein
LEISIPTEVSMVMEQRRIPPLKNHSLVEPREWKWLVLASAAVLLVTSIPYAVGYGMQNGERVFGGAVLNRPDYNVYLADIQSGLHGTAYYPMLHSPEDVRPVYLRLFYVWLGLFGRLLGLSAPVLFQLARWICGGAALLAMYVLAAFFFRAVHLRRFAWGIFVFGSGFGWLMALTRMLPASGIMPADFSQIELYGFLTILVTPHFALAEALQWITALAFLSGWSDSLHRNRWLGIGLILAVVLQTIQLFGPITLDAALAAYGVWRWIAGRRIEKREAFSLILLAAVQSPQAVYALWVFQTNPVWRSFYEQNLVFSPPVIDHVMGLGFLALFAVLGLAFALRRRAVGCWHLIAIWVLTIAVATYIPVSFQRRFVSGGMGPIALLVTAGVYWVLWPWVRRAFRGSLAARRRARAWMTGIVLVVVYQSTLWFTAGITATIAAGNPLSFDTAAEWEAMRWLAANARWQDPVFASEWTGGIIPAAIGERVYAGHWAESTDYEHKSARIEKFFQSTTSDAERLAILLSSGCRYVFYGPQERKIGSVDLGRVPYLKLVYENADVRIYEFVAAV